MKNLKNYFYQKNDLKKFKVENKILDKVISKIESLNKLALPTKRRLREYVTAYNLDTLGGEFEVQDEVVPDLIFVDEGKLLVKYEELDS